MIYYGVYLGAAGARRPEAGHGDILTYYFSILQPILAGLPFNMNALSRQLRQNFRDLHQTLSQLGPHFSRVLLPFSVTTILLLWNIVFRYHFFCFSIFYFPLEFRG